MPVTGTVTSVTYIAMLRRHLLARMCRRPTAIFQQVAFLQAPFSVCKASQAVLQDNAPAHKSGATMAFLAAHLPARVLPWPPRSPDLSPIENAWSVLKAAIAARSPTQKQLTRVACAAWEKLVRNRAYVAALFGSMPTRLHHVVRRQGGFAPY